MKQVRIGRIKRRRFAPDLRLTQAGGAIEADAAIATLLARQAKRTHPNYELITMCVCACVCARAFAAAIAAIAVALFPLPPPL